MTKPIRIVSTKASLVVYVNLELLLNASSTLSYSVPVLVNLLRYWGAQMPRHKKYLIVYWADTQGGHTFENLFFLRTRSEVGSSGWMAARYESLMIPTEEDVISLCR